MPLVCPLPCQQARGAPGLSWPPWTPLGAGRETWWWCDASLPWGLLFCSASFLRLPLPRNLGWAVHASSTQSRRFAASSSNLWLEGCTAQCCAPWQRWTVKSSCLSSGRVVLPPRRVSAPPPGGERFRVVRLEATVPSRKEITTRLLANEEDTQEQAPAGSFGLTSAPLNSPRRHRLPPSPPGAS